MPGWVDDVLRFWFDELEPGQWFKRDDDLDGRVTDRFAATHAMVEATADGELLRDARTALAAIIVLDQFPRNMFRGTPRAFASDAKALRLAERAIDRAFDQGLTADERIFLYLPFEHAESAAHQARCVDLCRALNNETYLNFALAHQAIIARFGRFPHRNAILGRSSTPEEIAFLAQPGSAF